MQDADNVYAPPEANLETAESVGERRLYSLVGIVVATGLGSVLGGGAILALNYRRLDRGAAALRTLSLAVLAQATLFGLFFALASSMPISDVLLTAPQVVVMYYLAKRLQGQALDAQRAAGRRPVSGWAAAVIGLLCGLLLLAATTAGLYEFH